MLCIGHQHSLGLVPKFKAKTATSGLLVWPCHSLIQLYLMIYLLDVVRDLHGSGSDLRSSVEAQSEVLSLSCYQPSTCTSVFQVTCYLVILVGLFVLQLLCNIIQTIGAHLAVIFSIFIQKYVQFLLYAQHLCFSLFFCA